MNALPTDAHMQGDRCSASADAGLPPRAGIGLKPMHCEALLSDPCPPGFVEVHAENYMGAGGAPHRWLRAIRDRMPVSLHGVGLSIGGDDPLDEAHLWRLQALVARYAPSSFSEHLAWSTHDGIYLNDLLPVAYTIASRDRVCRHIDRTQSILGMRMLLENPATYLALAASMIDEPEFITAVVERTGCGLLLDVSNVYVSCTNHGRDPAAYLDALPLHATGEVHLAGFAEDAGGAGERVLIDHHGAAVDRAVWALYDRVLDRIGPVPTLIEWDNEVPGYAALCAEAARAELRLRHAAAAGGPT